MSRTHPLVTEYGDVPPASRSESTNLGEEAQREPNPIAVQKLFDRYFDWLEEQEVKSALVAKQESS